jgi:hypothetical protein
MTLQDLIDHVGEPLFEQARQRAWQTAAGTGTKGEADLDERWPDEVTDVPHELERLVWSQGDAPWVDRVALACELYRDMPCYANLMYIGGYLADWDEDARRLFWNEYRTLVSDPDDRLADPVAYSLWCDYFENPETVDEAWNEIARPDTLSEKGLERVLDVAGPVPFGRKAALYEQLIAEERWHPAIFRSLLHSAFDVYGEIDTGTARELLQRLELPPETAGLDELKRKLQLSVKRRD